MDHFGHWESDSHPAKHMFAVYYIQTDFLLEDLNYDSVVHVVCFIIKQVEFVLKVPSGCEQWGVEFRKALTCQKY